MSAEPNVLEVEDLVVGYGETPAVERVSFTVAAGELHVTVSDAGMDYVEKGSERAWAASLGAVRDLLGRVLSANEAPLTVRFEASLAGQVVLLRADPDAPAASLAPAAARTPPTCTPA